MVLKKGLVYTSTKPCRLELRRGKYNANRSDSAECFYVRVHEFLVKNKSKAKIKQGF